MMQDAGYRDAEYTIQDAGYRILGTRYFEEEVHYRETSIENHESSIPGPDLACLGPVMEGQIWRNNRSKGLFKARRASRSRPGLGTGRAGINPEGFTLIEVVATLIIVGVLAAVGTTRFISTGAVSVRAAAEMVQADIRYAQEAAMAEHTEKSVSFVYRASTYTVDSENMELPSGVTIGNNFTVTFNSLGEPTFLPEDEDSVKISANGQDKTISVTEYTGKVSIS